MIYEDLFQELQTAGVRYLVVGGVAVLLHGFVRTTADLDLMVALDSDNLAIFLDLMKRRGYKPKVPVSIEEFADPKKRQSWIVEKGMKVFSLIHPQKLQELIDVFVDEPIPFAEAYHRREKVKIGASEVSVIGAEDLITLKKKSGRPQDLEDIRALESFFKEKKRV
ncbi:MAG: hypothetical protein A2992_03855 [Elusimicrobia bacterium RIFCSPLOWO2_01_FULL_59_12]|nr:MAG: hypothetical protein A2992_03855 [Elusimicrobia bacterium RIFCSPLOWO2_01_FULL_59_12]